LTSNQFFIEHIEDGVSRLHLQGREHHHLFRVARRKAGDIVWLVDSNGKRVRTRIVRTGDRETLLEILEKTDPEHPVVLVTLAQAMLPYRVMETILQKATEFGVAVFIPVLSERSLQAVEDRMAGRMERWKRIAREAVKQSKGLRMPEIHGTISLKRFLDEENKGKKLAFTEKPATLLRDALKPGVPASHDVDTSSISLLIGPEGGWTKQEEDDIITHGFETVSLGPFILRAETAAVAAVACVMHFRVGN
jgi:16S rRNA (uracil1498-N3)-methyltransferase